MLRRISARRHTIGGPIPLASVIQDVDRTVATHPAPSYSGIVHRDRIKIVPGLCEGRPTFRGLRLTVEFMLKLLGDGYTADDIVREYPELQKDDVFQAAKYGAWLASQRTSAVA